MNTVKIRSTNGDELASAIVGAFDSVNVVMKSRGEAAMTQNPTAAHPWEDEAAVAAANASLVGAADHLEAVAERARATDKWRQTAHDALREGAAAVESRLGMLVGAGGLGDIVTSEEPRLIPHLTRLETLLNGLLVEVWEAKPAAEDGESGFTGRLHAIVQSLRRAASREFNIAYEAQVIAGGEG